MGQNGADHGRCLSFGIPARPALPGPGHTHAAIAAVPNPFGFRQFGDCPSRFFSPLTVPPNRLRGFCFLRIPAVHGAASVAQRIFRFRF